jgi:hypothetical protein
MSSSDAVLDDGEYDASSTRSTSSGLPCTLLVETGEPRVEL